MVEDVKVRVRGVMVEDVKVRVRGEGCDGGGCEG